jgi:preprotein translocase subunit SecB
MKTPREAPTSGFHLLRVIAVQQAHSIESEETGFPQARSFTVRWDWTVGDDRQFDVFLGVEVRPSRDAPERVVVGVVGEFQLELGVPSLSLQSFVQTAAPAILFPYVRETISSLTGRGPHGSYYLPSINVVRMMKSYDFEATSGAQELRENPDLAKAFGWDGDIQLPLIDDDRE